MLKSLRVDIPHVGALMPAIGFVRQPPTGQYALVRSPSQRLVTVVLRVSNLDTSAALYRDGFGLDFHFADHEGDDLWTSGRHAATTWTDGAFLHFALYQSKDGTATTGAQIAFRVDDLEAAHRRALDAGADLVHAPKTQPWGRSARYRDPDGNVIELTEAG
jgi:catechol 2,3-dioxygenase-like lactoylglutathione lyase family enzyme